VYKRWSKKQYIVFNIVHTGSFIVGEDLPTAVHVFCECSLVIVAWIFSARPNSASKLTVQCESWIPNFLEFRDSPQWKKFTECSILLYAMKNCAIWRFDKYLRSSHRMCNGNAGCNPQTYPEKPRCIVKVPVFEPNKVSLSRCKYSTTSAVLQ